MALTKRQQAEKDRHTKYWQDREKEALKHYITDEAEYSKEIEKIYKNMLNRCQKEIDAFYGRYAEKEGITIGTAKKRVKQLEIEEYERKAAEYVKNKDFSDKANEEMRLYNATMKINRLEMLKANIGLEMLAGTDELDKFMQKILKGRTEEELARQAGILGKTVRNNAKLANALVNASFHNASFSDRVWLYHDEMKAELDKLLQQGLVQGKGARQIAKELRKHLIDPNSESAQFKMERLMRTELARVQTEAQKQSFEKNGFGKYTFIANSGCCPLCSDINGKHFDIKDMMPGLNAPPMHPFCRCSTAAYEDSDEYEEWLSALEQGKTTEEYNKTKTAGPTLTKAEMREKISEDEKRIKEIDSEVADLDELIDKHKISDFDDFKGLKKTEISDKISEIEKRLAEIEPIVDRYYNRPERGTDEYTKWREWKRNIDFDSIQSEQYRLIEEQVKLNSMMRKWDDYEKWNKWKKDNPLDELQKKKAAYTDEIKALKAEIADYREKIKALGGTSEQCEQLVERLKKNAVEYRQVKAHDKPLSDDEIIKALAGGDMTQGSCASVGLAYIGQKGGLNVLDFRDGESRSFFSNKFNLDYIAKLPGIKTIYETARSSVTAGNKLLKHVEVGKEYYLCCGRHAAIVRKTEDGTLQYLELQSAGRSGWTNFDGNPRYTLKWRFGENKGYDVTDFMIEVDSFKDSEDLKELLGYINTAEDKQRKGGHGTIK